MNTKKLNAKVKKLSPRAKVKTRVKTKVKTKVRICSPREERRMKRDVWKPLFSGFRVDGEEEAALSCGWCREKHKAG